MRVRNNDFRPENLQIGIDEAHALGKQFFLAANIMPQRRQAGRPSSTTWNQVVAMGPDALIMSDPGLILLVRERWPEMPIHLSVQANTMNAAAVRFWQQQGAEPGDPLPGAVAGGCGGDPPGVPRDGNRGLRCMARSASPTLGAVCFPATSTTADANQGTCTNCLSLGVWGGPAWWPRRASPILRQPRHPSADGIYYLGGAWAAPGELIAGVRG